jgi:hypothetical protein
MTSAPCETGSVWRELRGTLGVGALIAGFALLFELLSPGYFWHDDFQLGYLPLYCDAARALRQGEFPLLSPSSWQSGALAGEYQAAVFSLWLMGWSVLLFALPLSLPVMAACLSALHLAVLAMGTFRLARRQGLNADESLLAALVAALNGWLWIWGAMICFGHLASVAWVPWAWWAFDRVLARQGGRGNVVLAGVFVYLAITAAWVFAVLMLGVVTLWLAARALAGGKRLLDLWALPASWCVGLGLSAPAWLMLLEYGSTTLRGQVTLTDLCWDWTVPVAALPGLIFPGFVADWKGFWPGWQPHRSMELAGALVPLVLLAGAVCQLGRDLLRRLRWELGLTALGLGLAMAPGFGNFRWSFRWLPLFFLALGLTAGHALALLRQRKQGHPGRWAVALVLPLWLLTLLRAPDARTYLFWQGGLLLVGCLAWVAIERGRSGWETARRWAPCAVTLVALLIHYADPRFLLTVCTWPIPGNGQPDNRLDPSICYLSVHTGEDLFGPENRGLGVDLYPGSTAMYRGAHLINGYSALRPDGLSALFGFHPHGYLDPDKARRILEHETGPGGLLESLGVDGLVLARRFTRYVGDLENRGWRVVSRRDECVVLHRRRESPQVKVIEQARWQLDGPRTFRLLTEPRSGRLPAILDANYPPPQAEFAPGRAEVQLVARSRARTEVQVRHGAAGKPVLVALAQPWYPGYVAHLNGQPVPVYRLNLSSIAVLLPPDTSGQLVLDYRPRTFVVGCRLAALMAGFAVLLFVLRNWLGRQEGSREQARAQAIPWNPTFSHPEAEHHGVPS